MQWNSCTVTLLKSWTKTIVDPYSVLLYCLASIVYHSDWIKEQCVSNPGNPFTSIPVIKNLPLLKKLKDLVTLEPEGNILSATWC